MDVKATIGWTDEQFFVIFEDNNDGSDKQIVLPTSSSNQDEAEWFDVSPDFGYKV